MTLNPALRIPAIADLWRVLRAWLADALALSRGPAAVAKLLARAPQAAIKRRLQLIECMLMKLLLIEAARLPKPPSHPFPDARTARSAEPMNTGRTANDSVRAMVAPRPANRREEDPNDPQTWRVCFRPRLRGLLSPSTSKARARRPFPTHRIPTLIRAQAKARALARRFESIRRVIANPRRAIAALARRLRALGQAACAAAHAIALSRPPRRPSAPMPLAHAMVCASGLSGVFHNTS